MSEVNRDDSRYIIRNYQLADFARFVGLNAEAERLEPCGRAVSSTSISERLAWPHYSPERDLFIAELDGNSIAYLDTAPEPAIGRAVLDCWVHPLHRRKGLAGELLKLALKRAGEIGLKALHVNIMESDKEAGQALSRLGFECIRQYIELRLDMDRVAWQDIDPVSLGCHHLRSGEEDKLTDIQNRSFRDSWGYNPNPVETIIYHLNLTDHSPADVLLDYDGDIVTGYCWTTVTEDGKGRIEMIGTDPAYRGKGVGKRVLLCGLLHLKERGVDVTLLTVDSQNRSANALYDSIGFKTTAKSLWYEKKVG